MRRAAPADRSSQLQSQVVRLRAELSQAQLSKTEYQQLHKLMLLAGTGRYRVVPASVIAVGQGYQQTVTVDAGSADGVRANETVLNGLGLVGQVTAVTAHTATVLLASDSSSVVGVVARAQRRAGLGHRAGHRGQRPGRHAQARGHRLLRGAASG